MSRQRCVVWLFLLTALTVLPLHVRVLRVEIASRTDVFNGKTFGDTGAYERLTGLRQLCGVAFHDIYHAGQIRLLRRLMGR